MPDLIVEIAFGYTWASTTPVWTDVSTYVRNASWTHGRGNEFDEFSAGTATITLSNADRRFDPLHSSGPYFGNLKPMVPIRIRALHNATYYPRFYGYVDGFPQEYEVFNKDATCTITATDAFKVLERVILDPSPYYTEVRSDSPRAYWRLGESDGSIAADASGNRYDATYGANVDRAVDAVCPLSTDAAAGFTDQVGQEILGPSSTRIDSYPFTLEFWYRATVNSLYYGAAPYFIEQVGGIGATIGFIMRLSQNAADDIFFAIDTKRDTGGTSIYKAWNFQRAYDGLPHHVVCVVDSTAANCKLYIDGVEIAEKTNLTTAYVSQTANGAFTVRSMQSSTVGYEGAIDEVAIYPSTLSATAVADHYVAGTTAYAGESVGARIGRVLDLIGWPAALRSIDTGETVSGAMLFNSRTALDYLQSVARGEQGRFFVDKEGKITFHSRERFLTVATETTVQETFSDDGSDNPYTALAFDYSDQYIYNSATVTRDGGTPQTAENSSSISTYGKRAIQVSDLDLADDRDARAVAEYLVFRYSAPQLRVRAFTVKPQTTQQWTDALGLEVGYRINVERTPQGVGSAIDADFHVESITENVSPFDWEITYTASPVDPNSYFTWGGTGATQGWGTAGVWR